MCIQRWSVVHPQVLRMPSAQGLIRMHALAQPIRFCFLIFLAVSLISAVGCKKSEMRVQENEIAGGTTGVAARPGSQLAYEIDLQITLPAPLIAVRLEALRKACEAQAQAQSCSLLSIEQQQDQGSIEMRAAPSAIESLSAQAIESGSVVNRKIKAEDVTQALDDNALATESLKLQHEKFKALLSRADLAVSDAIILARELSDLEAAVQTAARDRALLVRRVETNLLRISFSAVQISGPAPGFWHNFSAAFEGFDATLAEALSEIILVLVYVLPIIFAMFPVALIWRWLWRKLTGKDRGRSDVGAAKAATLPS
jgi:Domain of unknown function (DUF4349)